MSQRLKPLKIAYFGSPVFSAHILNKLLREPSELFEISCVVTQPDKPVGRGLITKETPVKIIAQTNHIPIHDRPLANTITELEELFINMHIDLALVYAFNEFIPRTLMNRAFYGFWNIHPSILPRYRGPSPVVFPLILGDTETGVTLVQMSDKMDAGPILEQERLTINDEHTHTSLINLLSDQGLQLFLARIKKLYVGQESTPSISQEETQATYTIKLTRDNGYIPLEILQAVLNGKKIDSSSMSIFQRYYAKNPSFSRIEVDSRALFNLWRALEPWPGVWTKVPTSLGIKRLKINTMRKGNEGYLIEKVQLEGKLPVDWTTFKQGYPSVFS